MASFYPVRMTNLNRYSMSRNSSNNLAYPRLCALCAKRPTKLSQAMHNAGFDALGLPFTYVAFDTEDTVLALQAMRTLGIRGYSLTIPHKERALPLLDSVSRAASKIGAVNTVINDGHSLIGENTDCYGIENSLAEAEYSLAQKRVLLLGAGGAARAVVYVAQRSLAKDITVVNRTTERSHSLAREFSLSCLTQQELQNQGLSEFDVVFNTTAIGSPLCPDLGVNGHLLDFSELSSLECVFDAVTRETELIRKGREHGCKVVTGLRMLLFQAVKQFELFTEVEAPLDVLEKALYSVRETENSQASHTVCG